MSALTWARAAALLKLPRADGWPAALEPLQAAALQTGYTEPAERREAHVIEAALTDACRAGKIACEAANRPARPARRVVGYLGTAQPRMPQPPVRAVEVFRVGPRAFAEWLAAQGVEPSALVAAWVASQAAPVAQPAPADDGKRWTAERVAEARGMRDRLKAAGRRDFMAATAAHYAVTPQRLREVLGEPKRASKPKPGAAIARLVHRLK